jgi:hypothetical protein
MFQKTNKMKRQRTIAYKLRVINHYDRYKSFSKTSKEFIVDRKTLRQWVASRELLKKSTMKIKRTKVQYKSKKVAFPDMEKVVCMD